MMKKMLMKSLYSFEFTNIFAQIISAVTDCCQVLFTVISP